MAEIVIKCPPHLVESFCDWFSNSGEQDFYEAHQNGTWNETTKQWEESTTYIGTRGYGVDEPIEIVEYDKETDEEVTYHEDKITYLEAAAKFHSDEWNKMSVVTAYMHGWNKESN
ncbi:hypothetical protein VIPKPNUMC01_00122 [Klebsiella phage vB_VIPKPNUMC01]|nr:hypothetical protein VIPKPNUMC01_00122 [Klebsiella phage vB_VIPKPNUMC01]